MNHRLPVKGMRRAPDWDAGRHTGNATAVPTARNLRPNSLSSRALVKRRRHGREDVISISDVTLHDPQMARFQAKLDADERRRQQGHADAQRYRDECIAKQADGKRLASYRIGNRYYTGIPAE